jgi:hypothetical protein
VECVWGAGASRSKAKGPRSIGAAGRRHTTSRRPPRWVLAQRGCQRHLRPTGAAPWSAAITAVPLPPPSPPAPACAGGVPRLPRPRRVAHAAGAGAAQLRHAARRQGPGGGRAVQHDARAAHRCAALAPASDPGLAGSWARQRAARTGARGGRRSGGSSPPARLGLQARQALAGSGPHAPPPPPAPGRAARPAQALQR